jgi:hypothetical protein
VTVAHIVALVESACALKYLWLCHCDGNEHNADGVGNLWWQSGACYFDV